ncbi:hypothetical protein DV736_g3717, partial [Chaetothyriales sp. CBS 134916]
MTANQEFLYPLQGYPSPHNNGSYRSQAKSFATSIAYDSVPSRDVGSSSDHVLQKVRNPSEAELVFTDAIPAAGDGCRRGRKRPRRQRRPHSMRVAFFWWWVPEIVACVLSAGAILSIAIVLKVYDGRGLDDLNLPPGLTLNGLIAVLSTFDRVFLMVPVGSAISQEAWLWFSHNDAKAHPRSRLRDLSLSDNASRGVWGALVLIVCTPWRWLTVLGCVTSILSLGIGTFTQQLIVIETLPVRDNSSSLNPGNIQRTKIFQNFTGNPAEGALTPLLNMKAAIYNGFMATPGSIDSVVAQCPSGNCTFPATPSLAICGDCMETSMTLDQCNSTTCNYTSAAGSTFQMANWSIYATSGIGFVSQSSYGYHFAREAGDTFYLANFETFGAEYGCYSGCTLQQARPRYTAQECALWWCVNMYTTTISNGQQTQVVVDSFKTPNDTKEDAAFDGSLSTEPNITYHGTNYSVSWLAYTAIAQNLDEIVNGTVLLNEEGYSTSSDITQAIWSGVQTPKTWIQTVSTSMSNVVRTGTPHADTSFNGTGYQLGVRVRWEWLALPIVSVAASIILLLVVMVRTARSEVSAWKGSPLTFLLLDVNPQIRQAVNNAGWTGLASGIEKSVGQMKATLRRKHAHEGIGGPGAWVFEGGQ